MDFSSQLIFFFSGLGAFNGVLLSLYFFFFKKDKHISNLFLGGLLIVLSIRIWKSIFFYFNPELAKIYLQIGLSACFLIGPFLFFYIKAKLNDLNLKIAIYTLAFLTCFITVIGILFPFQTHVALWRPYICLGINLEWLFFILLSFYSSRSILKKIIIKSEKLQYDEVWAISVLVGVFLIWLAYFTSNYTSYISGALSFSFIFYLCAMVLFYKRNQFFTFSEKKEKYAHKIEETEANMILEKIKWVLEEQQSYKNPNLTLPILAKEINIRPQLLSQFLNDNLGKNFLEFVNEYRIEAAKKLLKQAGYPKMEVIAAECGFNSSSTFYSTFKKMTNTTPANYAKS